MKTYTAFFPREQDKEHLNLGEDFTPGDIKIIDGIAVSKQNSLILGSKSRGITIPFDEKDPPEIIDGYIFECSVAPDENARLRIKRSSVSIPRQRPSANEPLLFRIHTACLNESPISGYIEDTNSLAKMIGRIDGVSGEGSGKNYWDDALYEVVPGAVLRVRAAGTPGPVDWVICYRSVGPVSMRLSEYVAQLE